MKFISPEITKQIEAKATLHNVLEDYHSLQKKRGSSFVIDCPTCGTKDKLEFTAAKNIASCFKCDIKVGNPTSFLMKFHGKSYPEALTELARIENIEITASVKPTKPTVRNKKTAKQSFRDVMLENSGLTEEDVTDEVYVDDNTKKEVQLYTPGTFDERGEVVSGDDVIIHYYDLEGKPMQFYRKTKGGNATGNKKDFKRVRYQNPELHKDKNDKPTKYRSPYGSDSKIYINKYIRRKYKASSVIETLYIQEGEKKADKATKHGLISVGVMGIHNIAYNRTLPKEFELIVKRCQVKNVVFVLDEDWQNLSSKIDAKHPADSRPKSFHRAVSNFKNHFYAFTNRDIFLNIFFAYIKPNENKDKGIDDLLTNTLKGKTDTLKDMCESAIKKPDGNAIHLQFENITTVSEYKLLEFWGLQNKYSFFKKHQHVLSQLNVFKFGKVKYRFNDKKQFELAQPLRPEEFYWEEIRKENAEGKTVSLIYKFDYKGAYIFLQNKGYFRLKQTGDTYIFIKVENNLVQEVQAHQIKDFISQFTATLNNRKLENMLFAGFRYLGAESLSNLRYEKLNVHQAEAGIQYLYFNNECWKITKEGIETEDLNHLDGHIWKKQIKNFEPESSVLLDEVHQITAVDVKENKELEPFIGEWTLNFTKEGDKCKVLQFLLNTSDMHHKGRTRSMADYNYQEKFETTRNLLSKLTALGYLLHNYKDDSIMKAVIGMDSNMSEVGRSNGRSGKSVFGKILEQLTNTEFISGKRKDLLDDKYVFDGVNDRTQNVWIDDIRINFDLEFLFPHITGKFVAEQKGLGKVTYGHPIKFYIPTNHALKGETSSYKARQFLLGFGDWYDDKHQPIHDFGMNFWSTDWPTEQWNLFYNLAATSLHLYFKHGLIEAPTERLERRRLRQAIGENFLEWSQEYFATTSNLNTQILKSEMYSVSSITHRDGFLIKFPADRKYVTPTVFKKKLKDLCKYNNWEFNPCKKGENIKKGGKEYIEIGVSTDYYNSVLEEENGRPEPI